MERKFLVLGSLSGFLGVALGAFGAHILKERLDPVLLTTFETAVKYQMYHSLALILVAILLKAGNSKWLVSSGWLFFAGIVIFSGSLYVLSLTGVKWFGAFTPFGGLAFLGGWVGLTMYVLKK